MWKRLFVGWTTVPSGIVMAPFIVPVKSATVHVHSPCASMILQQQRSQGEKKQLNKDQLDPRFIHYAESDRMSRGGPIADPCRAASHRPRLPSASARPLVGPCSFQRCLK